MGVINKEWHAAHRMPPNPTPEQRGAWHSMHVDACGCRKPSVKEQALIDSYREAQDREAPG